MAFIETQAHYENTIMRDIRNKEDILIGYDIAPINGYVLHNTVFDTYEYDSETGERGALVSRGYSPSSSSVEVDYDFELNPSEIYAKKKDEIGENEVIY